MSPNFIKICLPCLFTNFACEHLSTGLFVWRLNALIFADSFEPMADLNFGNRHTLFGYIPRAHTKYHTRIHIDIFLHFSSTTSKKPIKARRSARKREYNDQKHWRNRVKQRKNEGKWKSAQTTSKIKAENWILCIDFPIKLNAIGSRSWSK